MVVGFLVFFPESMCKTTDLLVQGGEQGAQLHLDSECSSPLILLNGLIPVQKHILQEI